MKLSNYTVGVLCAAGYGLFASMTGFFGISELHNGLSIYNMLFWSYTIVVVMLSVFALPQYKKILAYPKQSVRTVLCGMFFYCTYSMSYFVASEYIGIGLAMVLVFLYPAMVIVMNIFLYNKPVNHAYYTAFFIMIIGMICIVNFEGHSFHVIGITMGVLSAFLRACYIIINAKNELPALVSTFLLTFGCAVTCLLLALYDGSFFMPTTYISWSLLTELAVLSILFPILLVLVALKYISPELVSILGVLAPVFSLVIGVVLLHNIVTPLQIFGAFMVLMGTVRVLLNSDEERKEKVIKEVLSEL